MLSEGNGSFNLKTSQGTQTEAWGEPRMWFPRPPPSFDSFHSLERRRLRQLDREKKGEYIFSGVFWKSKGLAASQAAGPDSACLRSDSASPVGPALPLPWHGVVLPGLLPFTVPGALPDWAEGGKEEDDSEVE